MRRASWIVILVVLALAAGCSKSGTSEPAATATPGSSVAASVDFKAAASALVADLAAGKFADVEAKFDATMKSQLSVTVLQNNWRTYQELVGAYKSHGTPTEVKQGEIAVEQVPIATATGAGEIRVSYHPDGTIAGLFLLRASGASGP